MSRSSGRKHATQRRRMTLAAWKDERHGEWRRRWNRSLLMGSTGLGGVLAGLALGAGSAWSQMGPNTLPTGGQVVAGSAAINQANPSTLNITQTTNRAVINWNSFDVGSNASVNFYQPDSSAWTLNRVTNSVSPSQILGSITANGNIAVINPNGVIFGAGSRVDVNGLIATTANISDQNFMAGTMKFDQAGNPVATVSNFGDITVKDAGLVAFVAPGVQNAGTITARLGTVSLAAGQRFTIDLYGDKLVSIATDGAVDQAPVGPDGKPLASLVDNSGRITADGGQVLLTARQASRIVDTAVNMSGVVQAQSAYVDKNGDIVLDAGPAGDVKVTGTLDTSGKTPGTTGGQITVAGKDSVQIGGTAKLDASGDAGGGKIKIGGDFHGQGTTPTAKRTTVASGAKINASAVTSGNGGQVVVWADDTTTFNASVLARGGDLSGNGGEVEISGQTLVLYGASVDTRAPHGQTGSLLLDPTSVTIVDGADNGTTTGGNITDGTLNTLLGTTDVTVVASTWGTGTGNGKIQVNTGVDLALGGNKLTLVADGAGGISSALGTITVQTGVTIAGGTLELQAGTVHLSSDIAALISNAGANAPSSVYIDTSSASIQDGIDIAGTGATVHLAAATTWTEAFTINKALTLQGASSNDSVVDGSGLPGTVITVNAPGGTVTIDRVVVKGTNSADAVVLVDAAGNFTFKRGSVTGYATTVTNNGIETYLDSGDPTNSSVGNFTVADSTITNLGGVGVLAQNAGAVVIDDNRFLDALNGAIDIRSANWTSAEVLRNFISGSSNGIDQGIAVSQGNAIGALLTVSSNTIGGAGVPVTGSNGAILIAVTAGSGTVASNTIGGVTTTGISVSSDLGTLDVARNTISFAGSSGNAIYVGTVTGVTVERNTITGAGPSGSANGILIDSGAATLSNVVVSRNTVSGLGGDGILVDPVFGPTVLNNTVFNVGGSGIEVDSPVGNVTVNNNLVDATGSHAIYIHDASGTIGNTISLASNTIGSNNSLGTISGGGIGGNGIYLAANGGYAGDIVLTHNRLGIGATPGTVTNSGIVVTAAGGNVTVIANSIDGTGDQGIAVSGVTAVAPTIGVYVQSNTIDNVDGNGIDVSDSDFTYIRNNSIASAPLSTAGGDGIRFANVTGVDIERNTIGFDSADGVAAVSGNGINGAGGDSVTVSFNTIGGGLTNDSQIGGNGITVTGATSAQIRGNLISNTGYLDPDGAGIWLSAANGTIVNNVIANSGGDGIGAFDATIMVIDGNSVVGDHDAGGNGVFAQGNSQLTITDSEISGVSGAGISVSNFDIAQIGKSGQGNSIANVGGPGISVSGTTVAVAGPATLRIVLNQIAGTGDSGIMVGDVVAGVLVQNNTLYDIDGTGIGIDIGAVTGSISIVTNTINATGSHAIDVHDATGTTGDIITIAGNIIASDSTLGTVSSGAVGGDGILLDANGDFAGSIYVRSNLIGVDDGSGGGAAYTYGSGIVVDNSGGTVTVANNVVEQVFADGIAIDTADNVWVLANSIANVSGNGISVANVGDLRIGVTGKGNTIDLFSANGIEVTGTTGNITIGANTITNGTSGIDLHDISAPGSTVSIVGNLVGTDGDSVTASVTTGITIAGVTIAGRIGSNTVYVTGDGIDLSDASDNWIITTNQITLSPSMPFFGGDGIHASGVADLTVKDNFLTGSLTSGTGILVEADPADTNAVLVNHNTVTSFLRGIQLTSTSFATPAPGLYTVSNNTVFYTGGNSVEISYLQGSVSVLSNTINASRGNAIYFHDMTGVAGDLFTIGGNTIGNDNTVYGTPPTFRISADGIRGTGNLAFLGSLKIGGNRIGVDADGVGGLTPGGINTSGIDLEDMGGAISVTGNSIANTNYAGITIANVGGGALVSGNSLDQIGQNGIALVNATAGTATVAGNTVSNTGLNTTLPTPSGTGILVQGFGVTIAGNSVANVTTDGIRFTNGNATIDGNTLSGMPGYGIEIADNDDFGLKFDTHAVLTDNTIGLTGSAVGIRVLDNSTIVPGVTATVEIGTGNQVSGGATGLQVDGVNTSLVGNTLSDIVFTGQSGNYVELLNGAVDNQLIDGRGASYDGVLGSSADSSQVTAIEAKITDVAEDSGVGDIVVNNSLIIVDGGTLQTIQDALDYGAGAHITVEAGTYDGTISSTHSSGGALTVWADDVILQGSGAPTLDFFSAAGTNAVVISGSGATFSGFAAINTGSISGAVVLVSNTGGGATISGNTITVGNAGAHGIQVQASDVGVLGNNVTTAYSTLGNGIFVDSGSTTLSGIVVSGNSVGGFASAGILIDPTVDPVVTGNTIVGPGAIGIEVADAIGSVTVTGNYVNNVTTGVWVHDATGGPDDAITIGGNTIGLSSYLVPNIGVSLTGNTIGGTIADNAVSISGIGIDVAAGGQTWSITGNSVTASGSSATLLQVSGAGNLAIEDNFFGGKAMNGSAYGMVVSVDPATAGQILIDGNTINSINGTGILVSGSTIASAYTITGNQFSLVGGTGVDVVGGGAADTVTVSGNSIVGGGTTTGLGSGVIIDSGSATFAGATVSDNIINGFNGAGIYIDPVFGPVVTGNDISSVADSGIEVDSPVGGATILSNTINATGANGIYVHGATGTGSDLISIAGNTIGNDNAAGTIGGNGVFVTGSIGFLGATLIDGNAIDNIAQNGITIAGLGGILEITDNRIASAVAGSTVGNSAITVSGVYGAVTIADNRIADNDGAGGIGGSGIVVGGVLADTSISGNTIGDSDSTIAGSGVSVGGGVPSASITIQSNTIVNFGASATAAGIDVVGLSGGLFLFGNRIHDGSGDGISLTGDSVPVVGGSSLGNVIDNVGGNGIDVTGSNSLRIDSNLIGTGGTIAQNGIAVSGVSDVEIVGNSIGYDSTGTVVVIGQSGISVQGYATVTVSANTIGGGDTNDSRIGDNGIYVSGGSDSTVSGNMVRNTGYSDATGNGITVSNGNNFTVSGNSIFNVANNGIAFGSASLFVISGNDIDADHDSRGTTVGNGIAGSGGGVATVIGNTISNVAEAGVSIFSFGTAVVGVDGAGNTISNADGYGVLLSTVGGSTIGSNTIGTTPVGVAIFAGGLSTISNNAISVTGVTSAAGITIGGTSAPMQILFNDIEGASAGSGIDLADGQFTITNNNVNGFSTGLHVASGTAVGNATVITNLVYGNNFSGNTIGVDHEGSGVIQASGNYWGFTSDDPGFQAYFAHNATLGMGTGQIDVTPFLVDGTDGNGATVGFVGNFHELFVTALGSELSGATVVTHGRIQEAVDLIPTGVGTNSIEIGSGTFLDNVIINRADITNLKLFGQGGTSTTIDGFVNSQAVISITAISTANAGDLTLQDFAVTGTTGGSADGIVTSTISHVLVDGIDVSSLTNATALHFVGGTDIVVTGASVGTGIGKDGISFNGSSDVSVTASTIAGVGRDGIVMVGVAGGTIGNNVSIGSTTRDGIRVLDSTGIDIGDGVSIDAAGRDGIRVQTDGPASTVSIGGVTIVDATDNGVNVIAGGGGTASVAFVGGTSIANDVAGAFNAVRVQGANASFSLPTPDGTTDLTLNIDAGDSLQNYFLLTNSAMGGTVTLGYDVDFIGLTGTLTSLQTYGLTAATLSDDQRAALFEIEDHMIHAVDNTALGLIRLVPDALFPTAAGGLNGVRNAIQLSNPDPAAQDTVFLQAGDYADPSNLAGGGLVIDRNLRLVGAQAGNVALGRDPTDAGSETILDFAAATVSPNNGIRITDPAGGAGVVIDGLVVQVGAGQGYGIRIDSGAARDNIAILNSFVRGSAASHGGGDAIQTAGSGSTVTGLTITGNVIEYFDGDGVDLANVAGLTLQNDLIQDIGGRGIDVAGSGFATSLSGNTLFAIGLDGIRVQNAATALVIGGNTIDSTLNGDGIEVDGATLGVTISGNSIAAAGASAIQGNGILVNGTAAGGVLVSGNFIGTASGAFIGDDGIHVQDTVLGGVSVAQNTIGNGASSSQVGGDGIQILNTGVGGSGNVVVLSNSIQHANGDGVFVDPTIGDVMVDGQNILNVGGNGIRVFQTTGKVTVGASAGNTINATGKNGILVDTTGEVGNSVPITGTGGVTVANNVIGDLAGSTIGSAGSFDGIIVTGTLRGDVLVADNSVASGDNVVVTRQGIYVLNTAGNASIGGNVTVQDNSVAGGAGARIGNTGLLIANTTLGSVSVLDNAVAVGDGATTGSDAIRVQSTGADASVVGNTIGNSTTAIGGEGIEITDTTGNAYVGGNTVFNVTEVGIRLDDNAQATVSGNTIDATGAAGILVLDTADGVLVDGNLVGALAGTTIGGAGIFVDRTTGGSVTLSGNSVATGAGTTLGSDAIHVDHTSLGSVFVTSNSLGNSGYANPNEGIDVANTSAAGVTINGNELANFLGFGIHVAQTYGMVAVGSDSLSGNTIDAVGLDGIRVNNAGVNGGPGGVLVAGNLVGTQLGTTIGGVGIYVDQTGAGSVTLSGNAVATGAGATLGNDAIRVDHTSLGSVFVTSNSLGNSGHTNPNEGIDVGNTSAGGVTINGNQLINFQGYGIHVAQTYGMVAVGTDSLGGNTIDAVGLDGIRVNNTGVNGGPGGVLVAGNRVGGTDTIGASGIVVVDTSAGNVTLADNAVGQGARIMGDGIRVDDTSFGGVTISGNLVGSSVSGAGIDGDGIQVSHTGLGVWVDGNSVTNAGFVAGAGRGIVVNITGLSGTGDSAIDNNTVAGTAGYGILARSIGGNLVADSGSVSATGDSGVLVDYADNVTVSDFTIDGAGRHGLHLRNIASGTVMGATITNSANDGLRLSRPDGTAPSMTVSVSNVTIDGAGTVGLRLIDNDGIDGGNTIALQVGSGISIANAPVGLIVDGPDTRNIGKTLNNMAFATIGNGTGNYIELRNAGWYEDDATPNPTLTPTQIDATHVSFDGVVAGSLDPATSPADVIALAELETRIVHFLDDPTLGLIRLQAHDFVLPAAGLNGIQLADYASAAGDSIYLVAGTYGDPSDLVSGGLVFDKPITLVGWQNGVSATSGGRDGVTDESILDFAGASSSPSAGIVIKASNVTIDGVAVLLDASQVDGGIVVDTSVARSDIAIINNFVHGTSIAFGGGAGILTSGSDTVTGLNISGNVIEFVSGNGISIDNGRNLTIQNNVLGNAGYGATNLNNGIYVTNSSFGAPVSGNVVNWTGAAGISMDGVTGPISITGNGVAHTVFGGIVVLDAQTVDISDNTLANIGTNGIGVQNAGDTSIDGNTLTSIGIAGIGAFSVGNVTVADNTVAYTSASGIAVGYADSARVFDNDVNATALQGISVSHSPSVDIEGNTVDGAGIDGILATSVGGVTIAGNSVGGSGFNGIEVQYADGASITGNTLSTISSDGIYATNVGSATIAGNALDNVTYIGIEVNTVSGVLDVSDNVLSTIASDGISATGVGSTTIGGNSLGNVSGAGIYVESADALDVSGNTLTAIADYGIHAVSVGGTTIVGNRLNDVGNGTPTDGIGIETASTIDVSNNTLSSIGSDGINANDVGNATIAGNSLDNVGYIGIAVNTATGTLDVSGNVLATIASEGISVIGVGNTTIGGNSLGNVSGAGIYVESAGALDASGNTLTGVFDYGIHAVSVGNTTIDANRLSDVGNGSPADGIRIETGGTIEVSNNILSSIGNDGISVSDVGETAIDGNSLSGVGNNGIVAATVHGGLSVLDNTLDGAGANGVDASTVFGDVSVSGNILRNVAVTGIRSSNTGNVQANGNSLDVIGGDGIVISLATSDASVQGNTLSHVSGNGIIVGQLTDTTITGNVLSSIAGTGIAASQINDATVGGNSLSDVGNDGINLSQAHDLVVGANQMARIAGDGVDIALISDVTVVGNILDDTGQDTGGAAIRLDNYTTATIVGNSIVSLTAMTGIAISNGSVVAYPDGNVTIAGNLISGNQIGIGTSGEVLGTITGNTITGNSQWGIVVGSGLTQTHLEGSMTLLDLLVTGNVISGNGTPMDRTLLTGGVRNDNIGLVLDARGNDWGDASGPFAGPTHFLQANPDGKGNAVSDWVLYDVHQNPKLPPIVPPFSFLLDSFARGSSHPNTPGDVLAIGPGFTPDGALFDPYFFDLFSATFALAQAQNGGNPALDYALCYLGNVWSADACQAGPGSLP